MIQSLRLRLLNIPDPPRSEGPVKVKLAILFSGGLDCAVLARMAHDILPLEEQIDLLNVAFENPRVVLASKQPPKVKLRRKARRGQDQLDIHEETIDKEELLDVVPVVCPPIEADSPFEACPDRMTGRSALKELRKVCPGRKWNFVEVKHSKTLHLMLLTLYLGQYFIRRILSPQKQSHISYIPTQYRNGPVYSRRFVFCISRIWKSIH